MGRFVTTLLLPCLYLFLYLCLCWVERVSASRYVTAQNPFHPDFQQAQGDNKGLKVLVVVVDNRRLGSSMKGEDGYSGIVAVLQKNYCIRHNYDYVRIVNNKTDLRAETEAKYPDVANQKFQGDWKDIIGNPKYGYDVLHPGYLRTRSSSWGKLPALWYTAEQLGHRYDYIWFMDSDATPNPMQTDRSLGDAIELWASNTSEHVQWGNVSPADATFLFFSNFPFREDLPCAGTIIFKPSIYARDAIREWWDFDLVYKARADFMEQDALWYMMENTKTYTYMINTSSTLLLKEEQFASAWRGYSDIWFAHIPSSERFREAYFITMLNVLSIRTHEEFKPFIDDIRTNAVLVIPFLPITEKMEELHKKPYRTNNPPEQTARNLDIAWHNPSTQRPPTPPVGRLYNGFLVQAESDARIFLVYNDTRHQFKSIDDIRNLGLMPECAIMFPSNWAHKIPHRNLDNIPIGSDIPPEGVTVKITPSYTIKPIAHT